MLSQHGPIFDFTPRWHVLSREAASLVYNYNKDLSQDALYSNSSVVFIETIRQPPQKVLKDTKIRDQDNYIRYMSKYSEYRVMTVSNVVIINKLNKYESFFYIMNKVDSLSILKAQTKKI